MGGITRQLKSYARKGDVDLEPVDLRDSVRAALSMMAPQLGKMAVKHPDHPALGAGDRAGRPAPHRADHRQPAAQRARRGAQPRRPARSRSCWSQGETILLVDRGQRRRASSDPDKLFEPFYTTKKPGEGLGLGLAISAGFAAELGGRLVARNAPDGGAVFELLLPRGRGTDTSRRVNHMNGKSKVAIIDDEADMRESVAQWLQLSGFEPVAFEAAEPALKALGADFAGVVISDIRMPGMDGMALLRRLQSIDPGPAGDPDDRPRRRADGGRGDAHRRLRLRREAVRPRPAGRALPARRRGARPHARDPGAAPRALRRQRADAPADGLEPGDREAARARSSTSPRPTATC